MSDQRKDDQLVDPADFVGEPPAGDAFLDDFVSNDQSAAQSPGTDRSDGGSEDES